SWLIIKLVYVIEYLNIYTLETIPSKTVSGVSQLVALLIGVLVGFLAWVNDFVFGWDQSDKENKKK
ncbi:MAG: hypothetical protein ACERKS_11665, partial [Candidatus Bathyarchaeota archaeon]